MPYEIVKREGDKITSVTQLPERVNYTVRHTMYVSSSTSLTIKKIEEKDGEIIVTLADPYDSLIKKEIRFK